jgi:excisionase family DNA binding protein
MEQAHDVFTPDQAAAYLQIRRETVYRYIRDGRLLAARLGRAYRIPRESVDRLLWSLRARGDISLREFNDAELDGFLEADRLTPEQTAFAARAEGRGPLPAGLHGG